MVANITNLPIEIILQIFSYLNRNEIILNCAKTTHFWKCIVSKFYIEPFIKFLAERNNINEIWNRFLAENNNIIENDAIKVYETLKKINYLDHNVLDILISPDEMQLYLYNFYKKEKYSTRSMDKILQQFQGVKYLKCVPYSSTNADILKPEMKKYCWKIGLNEVLKKCPKSIETLDIRFDDIAGEFLEQIFHHLANLPNLKKLSVNGECLDRIVQYLGKLPCLKKLSVSITPLELQTLQLKYFEPRSNYAIEELHGSRVLLIEDLIQGIRINSNEIYDLSLILPNFGKTFMTRRGEIKTVIAYFEDKINTERVDVASYNFFPL